MANRDSFLQIVEAFRRSLDLYLCVKILRPSQVAGTLLGLSCGSLSLHESAFCLAVKSRHTPKCKECDLRQVPARCEAERQIFHHTCHAGACEVIIPLFADDTLVALAYLGQFRETASQPESLPLKSEREVAHLLAMAALLKAYLNEALHTPVYASPSSRQFRREAIFQYMRRNLRHNPDLPRLASHLGLSTGRAGHVVREATGAGFAELRANLRLEHAKDLLVGTYY
jgi:AraC-like DNA-binding protein